MFATALTLGTTAIGRNRVFFEELSEKTPRQFALEGYRRRNTALDAFFYDVSVVTEEEANSLAPWIAREGAVVVVPPSDAKTPLTVHSTVEAFLTEKQAYSGPAVLAVAGVGSSALGSAAFARNIADALGMPVIAVVSGYGLSDLFTEALGGWFLFGTLNSLRHRWEKLDARKPIGVTTDELDEAARLSLDTRAVRTLLNDPDLDVRLVTGHSKGNLIVAEALYEIEKDNPSRFATLAETVDVVTVSAIIQMPAPCRNVVDVIGSIDNFGALNSRLDIAPDLVVAGSWHHTNTQLPFHLPITDVFRRLDREGSLPRLRK